MFNQDQKFVGDGQFMTRTFNGNYKAAAKRTPTVNWFDIKLLLMTTIHKNAGLEKKGTGQCTTCGAITR